jgi:hypothetical protein
MNTNPSGWSRTSSFCNVDVIDAYHYPPSQSIFYFVLVPRAIDFISKLSQSTVNRNMAMIIGMTIQIQRDTAPTMPCRRVLLVSGEKVSCDRELVVRDCIPKLPRRSEDAVATSRRLETRCHPHHRAPSRSRSQSAIKLHEVHDFSIQSNHTAPPLAVVVARTA